MKRKITAKEQYTTYAKHPLVAGDVRAYEICLDLGQDVQGAEFKVTAIRTDGKIIEDIGTVENGIASYTMASNMYSVPGELTVRLAVLHDMSVLTDREIVFEVLSGAESTDSAETVVPLNDSVILRLGNLEQKLMGKVDKVEGKGLSANDFTDEYKEKLDGLAESNDSEVERVSEEVDNLSDAFDEHEKSTNPHKVTAGQVGAYTKEEMDEKLGKKANKSDISNVYKFCGSVESADDLPFNYTFECNGAPYIIVEGEKQEIGTFSETTGEVAFNNQSLRVPAGGEIRVIFPVKPVTISPGWYEPDTFVDLGNIKADEYNLSLTYHEIAEVPSAFASYPIEIKEPYTVTDIEVIYQAGSETGGEVYFNLSCGKVTGYLRKVIYEPEMEYAGFSLTNGVVYNALDTGVNYAWTGTGWDALGGEHKDAEAREQIGKVDEAIEHIMAVQNELIGGEEV